MKTEKKSLEVLAVEIKTQLDLATSHIQTGLAHAKAAGEGLLAAKKQVNAVMEYGSWGDWLKDNFAMSHATACNFMKLAKNWKKIEAAQQDLTFVSVHAALKYLRQQEGRTRTPKASNGLVRMSIKPKPGYTLAQILAVLSTMADVKCKEVETGPAAPALADAA